MKAVIWFARVGCLCALAGMALPAYAQQPDPDPPQGPPQGPAQRPMRPLFGIATGSFSQSLTAGLSFGGVYDVEEAADESGAATPFESRGQSAFGNASLSYSAGAGRFNAGATVRSAGFYFNRFNTGLRHSSGVMAHGGVRLWRGSSLAGNYDLTYAPYHLTSFLSPAELLLHQETNPQFDPSALIVSSVHRRSSLDFGQPVPLTRRLTASVGYGFQNQSRGSAWRHYQHEARTAVTIGLTRGLAARLGYRYTVGSARTGGASQRWTSIHNIDSGFDFGRRLSFWRRLSLSFRTGLAALTTGQGSHFTATGGARLTWNMSQTWSASTAFNRDVQFVDDVNAAGVANALHASVRGALTRRLSIHGRFGTSVFDAAIGTGDQRVKSTVGSVGLSARVSTHVSVGVDYSNGHHAFGRDVVLFPGVPRERSRQAVQARVTVAAPLFAMTRRQ